jgi:hypothetical protein
MSKLDTILVVDDEINRKVAGLFLQRMGWKPIRPPAPSKRWNNCNSTTITA